MKGLAAIFIFVCMAALIVFAAPLFGDWQARIAEANSRAAVAQANASIAKSTASVAITAVTANTLLVAIVVGGALALAGIVLYFQLRRDEMTMQLRILSMQQPRGSITSQDVADAADILNRSWRVKGQIRDRSDHHIPTGAFRDDFN